MSKITVATTATEFSYEANYRLRKSAMNLLQGDIFDLWYNQNIFKIVDTCSVYSCQKLY